MISSRFLQFIDYIIKLRDKYNISQQSFILFLSFIIGILGAFAAIILKNTVHLTTSFLHERFPSNEYNLLYLCFPIIGITLTVIYLRGFVKDKINHGISRILWAISKNKSNLKPHNTYSSLVSSTLTVGFGGSVGLEAPIVLTGSAIGSNIGQLFKMNTRTKTLLIACGSSAAMAAIFKSPIAAIVFAIEVLMIDLTMASLLPLLIASITGTTISYLFLGKSVMFNFNISNTFVLSNIPFYIVLGVFCGFVSLYFTRTSMYVESLFKKINRQGIKILIGGTLLGFLIFLFPILYGEGYENINYILNGLAKELMHNSFFYEFQDNALVLLGFILLVLIFKVIAMAVTNGAGGIGGVFAPSLMMGGLSGYFVALLLKTTIDIKVPYENFTLAGMAGVMAGVMHSPLTAIFLIAEISGGYQLFIPLMITASMAYLTVSPFEKHSIYTKRLAARGELVTHHKDKTALQQLKVMDLLETNFLTVNKLASLRELVAVIAASKRNVFPVINENNKFEGLVFLDDIRDLIFKPELYDTIMVEELMYTPKCTVTPDETMQEVVRKFQDSGSYNMPVVDQTKKYIGFISRANLFTNYREIVEELSQD